MPISGLQKALISNGPAQKNRAGLLLYGQFVGSWEGEIKVYEAGRIISSSIEVHFEWVLEGRAIQDVWIAPGRKERARPKTITNLNFYGTTLRIYNPRKDNWRIIWINPVDCHIHVMVGRKIGDEIIQEYRIGNDFIGQWIFTEICRNSFHWIARESINAGKNWELVKEMYLLRY